MTPETEPRLTPPIVDPAGDRLKRTPAEEALDKMRDQDEPAVVDVTPPDKTLSPAEVEKGLRATLTQQNSDLEHALDEKKRWSTKVTELRAAVKETERWLNAATPRTRKPK